MVEFTQHLYKCWCGRHFVQIFEKNTAGGPDLAFDFCIRRGLARRELARACLCFKDPVFQGVKVVCLGNEW